MDLFHFSAEDHFGDAAAHFGEVRRYGRKSSEDYLVQREFIVGNDAHVPADFKPRFPDPAGQKRQAGVKLAVEACAINSCR